MAQFLQSYGILIALGLVLAMVLFRRGHGSQGMGGCGMGCCGEHGTESEKDKSTTATEDKSGSQHSGGCH